MIKDGDVILVEFCRPRKTRGVCTVCKESDECW